MTDSLHPGETDLRHRLERELGDAYVIQRELGGGGSAKVFLAKETALDRQVVLKVLPPSATVGVDGERFLREILIAARLQHPHLVPLLQAGTVNEAAGDNALRWFSMPYVEGQTLREYLLRRSRMSVTEGTRLLRELASALAYAHARGVVHRDIKPENILLSDGTAMIADFGVAKALDDASEGALKTGRRVTTVSVALGTPAYMSPEQISKAPLVDHKADIYAFGCLAYEVFAGAPPLERPTLRETLAAQVQDPPAPLQSLRPEIPDALAEIIMRCLYKDPLKRPHSASVIVKVIDELQQIPRGDGTAANGSSGAGAQERSRGSTEVSTWQSMRTTVLAVLISAVLVAGAVSWWYFRTTPP